MPANIPGYYFDTERNKYFKIEKASTAPSTAAWSSDSVKRRKIEDQASQAARRRERLLRNHVRRSPLWGATVTSGILRRELGELGSRSGSGGGSDGAVVKAAAWAEGVAGKGVVKFGRERRTTGHLACLWVGGEDEGLVTGVVYTTPDENTLEGSYIPTDSNGTVELDDPRRLAEQRRRPGLVYREMVHCPQLSSIKYHAPSGKMLLTSREPDQSCSMSFFSPARGEDGGGDWLLGETPSYERFSIRHRSRNEWLIHTSAPAPASSPDLICAIATNAGIMRVTSTNISLIESSSPTTNTASNSASSSSSRRQRNTSHSGSHHSNAASSPQEVFDLDWQNENHNLLLAGGRQPKLWFADLRTEQVQWNSFRTPSSVARLRSVGEYGVLVSCLRSSMAMYDLRFVKQRRADGVVDPIIAFPSHRNEAHLHIGFDVCKELGVVASAQENGTVQLFSLRSGASLRCPTLEKVKMETPIKALAFKRLPGEKSPSLFVGEGSWVRKYSWGTLHLEDEA